MGLLSETVWSSSAAGTVVPDASARMLRRERMSVARESLRRIRAACSRVWERRSAASSALSLLSRVLSSCQAL